LPERVRTAVNVFVFIVFFSVVAVASEGTKETGPPGWTERVRLRGTIEGDYIWAQRGDVAGEAQDSASYLSMSTVEIGTEVDFTDVVKASLVFMAEELGTDDETGVTVDEALMTLQGGDFPLYLIFGKRTQPFGVFENHLVSDPMTQDAYETKRVGVTAGIRGPAGMDLSATLYRGDEMMSHLFESGLFSSDRISRTPAEPGGAGSYIVSLTLSPAEGHLTFFGSYVSEPGNGNRNETLNAGLNLVLPVLESLRIDAEYMKALSRERYDGAGKEYREGVLSVTAAYEFVLRRREVIGGALFAERRAHVVSEPLEVAIRYEYFDDDGMAGELGMWTVDNRCSAGARYSFYHDDESELTAYVAAEYTITTYRKAPGSIDKNSGVSTRLGLSF